jgi:nitrate reductase gamma subunit
MPSQVSSTLHTAEIVHWAALGVMAIVYTTRILWLLHFKKTKDRSAPGGGGRTSAKVASRRSLLNVAMPWEMESTRKSLFFYLTFVLFHLGVVAGIAIAFLSTLYRPIVSHPVLGLLSGGLLALAGLIGVGRLIRRFTVPHVRLISTPDDYFSLFMLTCWFGLGAATQAHLLGMEGFANELYLIAYLYLTSFFLLYVPFSKISHYLYYPFTRLWIGRALGHRGSYPIARG